MRTDMVLAPNPKIRRQLSWSRRLEQGFTGRWLLPRKYFRSPVENCIKPGCQRP